MEKYENMDFDIGRERKIADRTEEKWNELENDCLSCTACELYRTRTNLVFGKGSKKADIMFIGEAPGESEDLQGLPFVGASGQLLDRYFTAVGLSPDSIYIANILKCRPPKNRDPHPDEEDACIGHLRNQLVLVKPKIIVCLGRISAKKIIKEDFRITAEHGKWFKKGNCEVCAVYHPSALLRDPSKREAMLEDMQEIKRRLDYILEHTVVSSFPQTTVSNQ